MKFVLLVKQYCPALILLILIGSASIHLPANSTEICFPNENVTTGTCYNLRIDSGGDISVLDQATVRGEPAVENTGNTQSFTNSGVLNSSVAITSIGFKNDAFATMGTLTNTGTIISETPNTFVGNSQGITNLGVITTLNNTGSITTRALNIDAASTVIGIHNIGTITTLNNSGAITARADVTFISDIVGIKNSGTITTLSNTGSITASSVASFPSDIVGISNSGTISILNNQQGSAVALSYTGRLPVQYNIIIGSSSVYGKLSAASVTGEMRFGISPQSAGSSIVSGTPYVDVLTGLTSLQLGLGALVTSLTGTSNGYSFTLSRNDADHFRWDLLINSFSSGDSGTGGTGGTGGQPPPSTQLTTGNTVALSSVTPVSTPIVFNGGTLTTTAGEQSNQSFLLNSAGGTITSPTNGSAMLSGLISGAGALTVNGSGTLMLTGQNTYAGGTTVASGTLEVSGTSPLGTGAVFVAASAGLIGTGTIAGPITVAGLIKPGHSPGYLATDSTFTMLSGSIYQQDIAGKTQANSTTLIGNTGVYSSMNVTSGQFVIQSGVNLSPRLSGLFALNESGYGSAIYVPVLGDKFTIITASNGIAGRFTTLTQPAELASGTQFIPFYNVGGSNSVELAVIPTSYANTLAATAASTRSVAGVLDQLALVNSKGTATPEQEKLLYVAAGQSASTLSGFAQSLAGDLYAATLVVVSQTTQRVQQAVLARLGSLHEMPMASNLLHQNTSSTRSTDTLSGSAPGPNVSSNAAVSPDTPLMSASLNNRMAWGEMAYQRGNRSGGDQASGFSSNLYQAVLGMDAYSEHGIKIGGGLALSNTNVTANAGTGTVQQGSLFLYGKLPVDSFVLDGMASYGLSSTDHARGDLSGYTSGLQAKGVRGSDALISAGLSRPIDLESMRLTPFVRLSWQEVNQSGFNEGLSPAALTVTRYSGNGFRGVMGLALGSRTQDPMLVDFTYQASLGVGVDSTNLINPVLNTSLAGFSSTSQSANVGATFVQAGLYATSRFADNAYAYAGLSGEVRSGQTLGNLSLGVRIQF